MYQLSHGFLLEEVAHDLSRLPSSLRQLVKQYFHLLHDFGVSRITGQILQLVRVLCMIKEHRAAVLPFGVAPAFSARRLAELVPEQRDRISRMIPLDTF